jgi:hypothetical protein
VSFAGQEKDGKKRQKRSSFMRCFLACDDMSVAQP